MASISNVVNVALIPEGRLAQTDNMNICLLLTDDQSVLSTNERYRIYREASQVANDFGSSSKVTQFANTFFATEPNPSVSGGYLVVGYHRGAEEVTADSAAVLKGALLDKQSVLSELQTVQDGSFDIDVDGTTESVTGIDFRTAATFSDVVELLNSAITGATVTEDEIGIVITSDSTGATSTLTYATEGATGTYVGASLQIEDGTGATLTQGAASETLTAETQLEALTALKALINFKGFASIKALTPIADIATWAQANSVLAYEVFTGSNALQVGASNPVWQVKLSGQDNFRCLFSKVNNRKLAVSYMARMHVVNFNAENSALTMNLKTLAVPAEDLTETEITSAARVGLDVYTIIKDTPCVLCSGANGFADNSYNFIAFIDGLQTGLFNILKQTGTKIPQTTSGVNTLVGQAEAVTRRYVNAGVFGAGEWTSPDTFGDLETFKRNIREQGFYFLAGRLSDQPQSDRQDRKSPVIQGAVKNAGAIHKADVIVNLNL